MKNLQCTLHERVTITRYINGKSFVLRKKEEPFKNLFHNESVVTRNKVENMEKRLKKDVLIECRIPDNRGNILIHDEEELHSVSIVAVILKSSSIARSCM